MSLHLSKFTTYLLPLILLFQLCQGQELECSPPITSPFRCCDCRSPDQGLLRQCVDKCPPQHYISTEHMSCVNGTPVSERVMASWLTMPGASTTVQAANGVKDVVYKRTDPTIFIFCLPCHESCTECYGTDAHRCLSCQNGYSFSTVNEKIECVRDSPKETSTFSFPLLAVLVTCCCIVLIVLGMLLVCIRAKLKFHPKSCQPSEPAPSRELCLKFRTGLYRHPSFPKRKETFSLIEETQLNTDTETDQEPSPNEKTTMYQTEKHDGPIRRQRNVCLDLETAIEDQSVCLVPDVEISTPVTYLLSPGRFPGSGQLNGPCQEIPVRSATVDAFRGPESNPCPNNPLPDDLRTPDLALFRNIECTQDGTDLEDCKTAGIDPLPFHTEYITAGTDDNECTKARTDPATVLNNVFTRAGTDGNESTTPGNDGNESTRAGNDRNESTRAGNDRNESTRAGNDANESTRAGNNGNKYTRAGNDENEYTTAGNDDDEYTTVATDPATVLNNEHTTAESDGNEHTTAGSGGNEHTTAGSDGNEHTTAGSDGNEHTTAGSDGNEHTTAGSDPVTCPSDQRKPSPFPELQSQHYCAMDRRPPSEARSTEYCDICDDSSCHSSLDSNLSFFTDLSFFTGIIANHSDASSHCEEPDRQGSYASHILSTEGWIETAEGSEICIRRQEETGENQEQPWAKAHSPTSVESVTFADYFDVCKILLKDTLSNLLPCPTQTKCTQTTPYGEASRKPSFSPRWEVAQTMTSQGGRLQKRNSDVRLDVPPGAVPAGQMENISVAVSVDLDKVHRKLGLGDCEYIASPVAEYDAKEGFRFQVPVLISLPHFLPKGFCKEHVKVYKFNSDETQNICQLRVLPSTQPDTLSDPHSAASQGDSFYFGSDGDICILTTHFCGYVCTACGEEFPPPTLHMNVFACQEDRGAGGQEIKLSLQLWDSRLRMKDFGECSRRVSRMHSELVHVDSRSLPAVHDSDDYDTGYIHVGARLHIMDEEDSIWQHRKRYPGGELCMPVESTVQLNHFVPCSLGNQIPYMMEWLLRTKADSQVTIDAILEVLIDVGYVAATPTSVPDPITFMTVPRCVTMHLRVSKSLLLRRQDELRNGSGDAYLEESENHSSTPSVTPVPHGHNNLTATGIRFAPPTEKTVQGTAVSSCQNDSANPYSSLGTLSSSVIQNSMGRPTLPSSVNQNSMGTLTSSASQNSMGTLPSSVNHPNITLQSPKMVNIVFSHNSAAPDPDSTSVKQVSSPCHTGPSHNTPQLLQRTTETAGPVSLPVCGEPSMAGNVSLPITVSDSQLSSSAPHDSISTCRTTSPEEDPPQRNPRQTEDMPQPEELGQQESSSQPSPSAARGAPQGHQPAAVAPLTGTSAPSPARNPDTQGHGNPVGQPWPFFQPEEPRIDQDRRLSTQNGAPLPSARGEDSALSQPGIAVGHAVQCSDQENCL